MIRIDHLQKSFGTKTVLDDVSFHFPEGERIALVGSNGAGKSTLLDILTGTIEADRGEILRPSRLTLGYLPQEPNPNPQDTVIDEVLSGGHGFIQDLMRRHRQASDLLSSGYTEANHRDWEQIDHEFRQYHGYAIEGVARSILRGLGFDDLMLGQNPRKLSGGWRMRLEIAKIFLNRPNFLILDEPTNHLDLPSLVWVESWLQNFEGTLVFVSHDQRLLRRLPTMTLHLAGGKLTAYQGNFDYFLEERERRQAEEVAQAQNLRRQREHLERFVERFGAKATKASQAQSKLKMIAKIRDLESGISIEDSGIDSLYLDIPTGAPSGREVLTIEKGAVGYAAPLCQDLNLLVERGQRVAIIGANGIGKSTFLKTIAAELNPLSGVFKLGHNVRVAWFAQDQLETLQPDKTVLENVLNASGDVTLQSARNILGALLFRGDDVNKRVRVLSGGEKARVGLARLLVQQSNFLLLDEPTNHLDISSCEILAQALQNYEGTILFVSHDREFIDNISTHVFAMLTDGRARLFEGRLGDYSRQASLSGFPDVLHPIPDENINAKSADKESFDGGKSSTRDRLSESEITAMKRAMQRDQRKIEQINVALSSAAKTIAELDEQMGACGEDFQKVANLATRRQDLVTEMDLLEQQWFELTESVDKSYSVLQNLGRI